MPASGLPSGTALRVGPSRGGSVLSSALLGSRLCQGVWGSGRGWGLQVKLRRPRKLLEESALPDRPGSCHPPAQHLHYRKEARGKVALGC